MKTIQITQQEMQQATRPNVYRNRKKYTRKDKHRGAEDKQSGDVNGPTSASKIAAMQVRILP